MYGDDWLITQRKYKKNRIIRKTTKIINYDFFSNKDVRNGH